MTARRYFHRTDQNLSGIVEAYRQKGCTVDVTNGKWDLTIGYGGLCDLVEVKNPEKPKRDQRYTKAQVKFRETWTGGIRLIMSLDDVTAHVEAMRSRHETLTLMSLVRYASNTSAATGHENSA